MKSSDAPLTENLSSQKPKTLECHVQYMRKHLQLKSEMSADRLNSGCYARGGLRCHGKCLKADKTSGRRPSPKEIDDVAVDLGIIMSA